MRHVKALLTWIDLLNRMNDATVLAEVTNALEELLIDHVEATSRTESKHNS